MAVQRKKSIADIQAQHDRIQKLINERGGSRANATLGARGQRASEAAQRYEGNIVKNNARVNRLQKKMDAWEARKAPNMVERIRRIGVQVKATRNQYMGLSKG